MRRIDRRVMAAVAAAISLTACVAPPLGPTIPASPGANKSFDAFAADVCPMHGRPRQFRSRFLAAARRSALWGARPAALRGSAGPAALRSRGLSRGLSGGLSWGLSRSAGSAAPGILTGLLMSQAGIIRGRLFSVVGQEQLFQPTAVRQQASPSERLFLSVEQPDPRLHPGAAGDFVPFFNKAGPHAHGRGIEDQGQFHHSYYNTMPSSQWRMPCWI
jgi:hypothetical protein